MQKTDQYQYEIDEKDDEEEEDEADGIECMNIIFLPFHPVFRFIVLVAVTIKALVTPIEAIYPVVHCDRIMDTYWYLTVIKFAYTYICDAVYAVDTLLHIMHRLADISARREFLPKSKLFITVDIISLIPFYRLLSDACPPIQFWPNVTNLISFVIIYKIEHFFSLRTTHNPLNILVGGTILILLVTNFVTCFLILTTHQENNNSTVYSYDWRKNFIIKINETDSENAQYIDSLLFVSTYTLCQLFGDTKPENITEHYMAPLLMMSSFVIYGLMIFPKSFGEATMKLRGIFEFFPRVQKIIAETKRRSHLPEAHVDVANFYDLMWKKRYGITSIPEMIIEFPRHLRLDIKQDFTWPIFYHSPTLRRTSVSFQHWLCDLTHLDFKLPNENFFANPHCLSHFFYLKSGIVQLISSEDGTTPLLSVTSGTIFGDISFFLPRSSDSINVIVRCMTYCEIYFFTRADILQALHKFPEDRKNIFDRIKNKIKHAKTLYSCKKHVKGLDRAEDEGVFWIKKRWWELSEAITTWKKTATMGDTKFVLPSEDTAFHCSKYIGQLVLCPDEQLQMQSMFANCQFPWMLMPDSAFDKIWQRIVQYTVSLVLILYPPLLTISVKPKYFLYFQAWTNTVYIADICLSLLTAIEVENSLLSNFASVFFRRCKNPIFILNLLAAVWLEDFIEFTGKPELYTICQFNRLIKVYVVIYNNYTLKDVKSDTISIVYQTALIKLSFVYITGYFVYELSKLNPVTLRTDFFFGGFCENVPVCDPTAGEIINIAFYWTYRNIFIDPWPNTVYEVYLGFILDYLNCLIVVYCAGRFIAVIYFKNKNTADYLYFALNIKNRFHVHYVHPELWNRFKKYLNCYWKFNKELEVTDATLLRHEPYDIYWKAHGEIAAGIIMNCKAFIGTNPALIKELAHYAKFKILPKKSTISLTGVPVKDVSWLVNGVLIKECQTETGVDTQEIYGPYDGLIYFSAFFGKPALATFTTYTECEMLYMSTVDFFRIINRYPLERLHIQYCTDNFASSFDDLFKVIMVTRKAHHWNEIGYTSEAKRKSPTLTNVIPKSNWRNPESKFMKCWMPIRAVFVVISIISTSLQGGSGARHRYILVVISALCDSVTVCDIFIKSCAAYYDNKGVMIYHPLKCMTYYFSRGLIMDIISILPWESSLPTSPLPIEFDSALLVKALSKYARLHLLMGYLDYLADGPVTPAAYLMIFKSQLIIILLQFTASHYLISKCVIFAWDDANFELINASKRDGCWLPEFLRFDKSPSPGQLRLLFGESFHLAQCAFSGMSYRTFNIRQSDLVLGTVLYSLTVVYWTVFCYTLAMLTLSRRGSTLFQHAFGSLVKFLNAERLDDVLIDRSLKHFSYWWQRTKSVNIYDNFMSKRVSSMFKQDLVHYFCKSTFSGLDTLLQGGEQMMKHLSCVGSQHYLLPNVPIMREMDLNPWVFIVHRGQVAITQDRKTLAILKKGSIFGQLTGSRHRPVRVSAQTMDYTDVIRIPVGAFQENIDDTVRRNIHHYPESDLDYIQLKNPPKENPYYSIRYLLRGGKTIKMPWMKKPIKARSNAWYSCWLGLVWVIGPSVTAAIVLILNTLPKEIIRQQLIVLIMFDLLHFAHFVSEFYTMQLVVIDDKCEDHHIKLGKFMEWQTYLDILSLVLPLLTIFTHNWFYQLARLLRLRFFYDFHEYFCQDFKNRLLHFLVDLVVVILILHAMVCGWVVVACRQSVLENTYYIPKFAPPEDFYQKYHSEWVDPEVRGEGCKTLVFASDMPSENIYKNITLMVPLHWQHDYAIALGFVMSLFTRRDSGTYAPLTYAELWYKCVINFILSLVCFWVSSLALRTLYLRYRELLNFDYNVGNLFTYLKRNGLNSSLLDSVKEYTILLWQKQRGNWMPELVLEAPLCLREDLFVALYSYHLQDIPLFRSQPAYFTRQLVTRLHRVVIFPGRALIQAGDIFGCMYFIHEGEVEKWYTDSSGEKKMVSLLTTNGFFGVIPGLFPDTAVQFTFVTRTVVDMVFLRHKDWQDLLEGYPDIKRDLYAAARQLKKDLGKA